MPDAEDAKNEWGERLAKLRLAKGLSQDQLAERLDTKQPTVAGWEGGKIPQLRTLVRLADFYDVDLRWLVTGEGVSARRDPPDAARRLEAIRRIADPAQDVSDAELRALLERTRPPAPGVAGGGGGP